MHIWQIALKIKVISKNVTVVKSSSRKLGNTSPSPTNTYELGYSLYTLISCDFPQKPCFIQYT